MLRAVLRLRRSRSKALLVGSLYQLSWQYLLLSHVPGTNLKNVVRISPPYLGLISPFLAAASCATDVERGVQHELNPQLSQFFFSPLTGTDTPITIMEGFYERNQYLFWCFCRSDLDGRALPAL